MAVDFDYGWKLTRIAYTTDHDPREHKIGFGFSLCVTCTLRVSDDDRDVDYPYPNKTAEWRTLAAVL